MNKGRDEAELWLSENDNLYYDWRARKELEYPYLTKRQIETVSRKEIPIGLHVFNG